MVANIFGPSTREAGVDLCELQASQEYIVRSCLRFTKHLFMCLCVWYVSVHNCMCEHTCCVGAHMCPWMPNVDVANPLRSFFSLIL